MKHYVISNQNKWATGGMSRKRADQICAMLNNNERLPGEMRHGPRHIRDLAKPYRVVVGNFQTWKQYEAQI